jgi:hypothetical protein
MMSGGKKVEQVLHRPYMPQVLEDWILKLLGGQRFLSNPCRRRRLARPLDPELAVI